MRKIGLVIYWLPLPYILSIIVLGELVRSGFVDRLDALVILYPFYLLGMWFGVDLSVMQAAFIIVGVQLAGFVLVSTAKALERGSSVNT